MCLVVDAKKTARYKKAKRKSPWITCYKQVECSVSLNEHGIVRKILAPYMGTAYRIRESSVISIRGSVTPDSLISRSGWRGKEVHAGIHAYLQPRTPYRAYNIIKCKGHIDDLIAVGHRDIAFTKLQICEPDLQRMRDFLAGVNE